MTEPVLSALREFSGHPIWVVGGAVRDRLLGRPARDVDIAVEGDVTHLGHRLAAAVGGHFFVMHPLSQTARIALPNAQWLDIVPLPHGLDADLRRRDFTVNAMALPLTAYLADGAPPASPPERLVDPTGGWGDLQARVIRATNPDAFLDDPVRTLRALRLRAALPGARIEDDTLNLLREAAPLLSRSSHERQRDEWLQALDGRNSAGTVETAADLGLLDHVLPGWRNLSGVTQNPYHHLDVWDHTLAVLRAFDGMLGGAEGEGAIPADLRESVDAYLAECITPPRTRRSLLRQAILLHDIGKPDARTEGDDGRIRFLGHERLSGEAAREWAGTFHLSGRERAFLGAVVGLHMRPGGLVGDDVGPRAVRRLFRDAGPAAPALLLLNVADRLGARGPWTSDDEVTVQLEGSWRLLREWVELSRTVALPLPLSGRDIMEAFSLEPGPHIGRIIQELRDLHAETPFRDRQAALEAAVSIQHSASSIQDESADGSSGLDAEC